MFISIRPCDILSPLLFGFTSNTFQIMATRSTEPIVLDLTDDEDNDDKDCVIILGEPPLPQAPKTCKRSSQPRQKRSPVPVVTNVISIPDSPEPEPSRSEDLCITIPDSPPPEARSTPVSEARRRGGYRSGQTGGSP